ncbi:MAG: aspartate-semialdehyde dehydrogenase [Bdellovibrionaceae bacterium]|nr:aspartate-semialdehyde dehydrogenase [Pseudobdellovibrionaceae bacterium]
MNATESKRPIKIGILGATGLVGTTFLNLLEKSPLDITNLVPFASERSAGQQIQFRGKPYTIEVPSKDSLKGLDLVFVSSEADISEKWAPVAIEQGTFVVDNSSAFRMDERFPLVVPEVNKHLIQRDKPTIFANPNCSTIQLMLPLYGISQDFTIESVRVASYQSVSGAGKEAQEELLAQSVKPLEEHTPKAFPHPIAFNTIPQIGSFLDDGFCSEEDKIMRESRKILNLPDLNISAFTVRVPSLNGHAEAVWVRLKEDISKEQFIKALKKVDNLVVMEEGYPVVRQVSGQTDTYVGRIHQDRYDPKTWLFWVVADNLLKGAAWNALQIAETLYDH